MKNHLLIACLLIISVMGCKKDKPIEPGIEERKPEVLIKDITTKLASADSISAFTNVFKNIALTVDETSQGITVFAPLNENTGAQGQAGRVGVEGASIGRKSATVTAVESDTAKTVLTDAALRDHIVKGVFNFADLTDGRVLTGLSGKQLKVSRSGNVVWINGIRIGDKQIVSSNNEAVFAVKSSLSNTTVTDELQSTSLEVTVWDATLWSTTKPKGEVAANATVVLYHTQQNYADSVQAYQGTTNAAGKVVFNTVTPGTYYIKVLSGTKSNIFNRIKQGGLYVGFGNAGIFQTQAEITAAPNQSGASPGDFKWLDGNGDGIINDNDRVTLPYEKAVVVNGALKKVEVQIGIIKNTQAQSLTELEFNTGLATVEDNISSWHKTLTIVDALLSRQAVTDSIPLVFNNPPYQAFGTYSYNPTNSVVVQIWQQAYNHIATLTNLQSKAPATLINRSEKLARIRATRAYVYLQLLTYFGNIPLSESPGNLSNSNRAGVVAYLIAELQAAINALPTATSGIGNLNSISVKALYAKTLLLEKRYAEASTVAEEVLSSGRYMLSAAGSQFESTSSEILWDNSANMDVNVKSFFFNRARLPYVRLTEVYLIAAEAALASGNTVKAQTIYSQLSQRSNQNDGGTVSVAKLRSLWSSEMRREGNVFASMLRWDTATATLGPKGFVTPKHNRLPIPQTVLDQNQGMIQNPGY